MSKEKKLNITKVYAQKIKESGKTVTIKEFSCCGPESVKKPKKVRK